MLRGVGCKPGWGIGHTFNQVVKPHVNSLRPKGFWLGTNLAEVQALAPTGPHHPPSPGEKQEKDKEDQPQGLVPGEAVKFDKHVLEPSQVSKTPSSGQQNRTVLLQKAFQGPDPSIRRGAEERKLKHLPDPQEEPPSKSKKAASRGQHRLHRDLRVRLVNKRY
ncbi:G patch domain and KOW motifs-containing protein [Myotis brandtii]|uniref:G-patch domain and KOW motifs-containing protein n=1 Tax=Myotis brandtii TaxID=109478 RepID=S7PA14_MYOBR|nr:G patch domain and KOW motifs-containing protein [Myotis brandtii]